jgi:hypothetical protein
MCIIKIIIENGENESRIAEALLYEFDVTLVGEESGVLKLARTSMRLKVGYR